MEEEEDRRRETAMAATPLLQPNFQSNSISHTQLHKLKELRRRRLQIKKNSSSFKKMKGKANGDRTIMAGEVGAKKDTIQTEHQESVMAEESFPFAKNEDANKISKKQNAPLPWKKQHKLHWGGGVFLKTHLKRVSCNYGDESLQKDSMQNSADQKDFFSLTLKNAGNGRRTCDSLTCCMLIGTISEAVWYLSVVTLQETSSS